MQVSLQNLSDLQNEHYKNPQLLSKGINSFIFQQIFSWLLAVDILGQCDSNIFDYLCTVYGTQCDLVIQTYCCLLPVYLNLVDIIGPCIYIWSRFKSLYICSDLALYTSDICIHIYNVVWTSLIFVSSKLRNFHFQITYNMNYEYIFPQMQNYCHNYLLHQLR